VQVRHEHISDEDELARRLAATEVVVVMRVRTPITASLLPDLRLLVTTCMTNAAKQWGCHGVRDDWVGQRGARAGDRPDHRAHPQFRREQAAVRAGGWKHTIGPGLAGLTLGVVGRAGTHAPDRR
jgi:phosphoglycerate dehydrogenase-like enzyme